MWWSVCVWSAVCLGTEFGINHGHLDEPWERYESYRRMYSNCTYVDGNLEILFLDGEHHYDMTFLAVCRRNAYVALLDVPISFLQ